MMPFARYFHFNDGKVQQLYAKVLVTVYFPRQKKMFQLSTLSCPLLFTICFSLVIVRDIVPFVILLSTLGDLLDFG